MAIAIGGIEVIATYEPPRRLPVVRELGETTSELRQTLADRTYQNKIPRKTRGGLATDRHYIGPGEKIIG